MKTWREASDDNKGQGTRIGEPNDSCRAWWSRWTILCLIVSLGVLFPREGGAMPQTWCTEPSCTTPPTCGQWSGPYDFDISCQIDARCPSGDEIGHAAVIPTGTHKGRVLLWTRCDYQLGRVGTPSCSSTSTYPYRSHIFNPATMDVLDTPTDRSLAPSFDPALPGVPDSELDGPFCSGHTWILDSAGNPKFLVAGGTEHVSGGIASDETYWFDPSTGQWAGGPDSGTDLPGPLPAQGGTVGSWYPSVITFLDQSLNPDRFRPIVLGGTATVGGHESDAFIKWWTMSLTTLTWTVNDTPGEETYRWQDYPRAMFLNTASSPYAGELVTAGQDHIHSNPRNSCQKIDTSLNPQTHAAGPNPDDVRDVEAWHLNNAFLLHTLKPGWVWDAATPLSQYDQNRIIGTMGTQVNGDCPDGLPCEGLSYTLEYTGSGWFAKKDAFRGRIFSNAVLLPDRTILVVGGQTRMITGGGTGNCYWGVADRFDPQGPSDEGIWTALAAPSKLLPLQTYATPRGYHSCAVLLPDASVLLMGGQQDNSDLMLAANAEDTADHFKPPYLFQSGTRPVLQNAPNTIRYGQPFCLSPLIEPGHPIARFCLIGLGSVTHHFDYGQRYVELMFRPPGITPPGLMCFQDGTGGTKELLGPPTAAMAPEGYYMLFGVDDRGVPSVGKIVKVTF